MIAETGVMIIGWRHRDRPRMGTVTERADSLPARRSWRRRKGLSPASKEAGWRLSGCPCARRWRFCDCSFVRHVPYP